MNAPGLTSRFSVHSLPLRPLYRNASEPAWGVFHATQDAKSSSDFQVSAAYHPMPARKRQDTAAKVAKSTQKRRLSPAAPMRFSTPPR